MKIFAFALVGAMLVGAPAMAQDAATSAPKSTNQPAILRTGTPVALKMAEDLTTKGKKLRVGQRVHLTVSEPVLVNGAVVIPAGSAAVAELTDVRNKGMWGKSGHIGAQLLYVSVNGRQIRLSGQFDDKGVTGTAGVVAAVAFVPIAGFLTTGTSAKLPIGSAVKGFVDEDVPLSFGAPAQVSLAVAAPASPTQAQPLAVTPKD
jgi:hypothetical protein